MRALLSAILLIAQLDSRANGFPSANDACISDFTLVPTTSVGRETPQLDSRVSLLQPHGNTVGTATSGYRSSPRVLGLRGCAGGLAARCDAL